MFTVLSESAVPPFGPVDMGGLWVCSVFTESLTKGFLHFTHTIGYSCSNKKLFRCIRNSSGGKCKLTSFLLFFVCRKKISHCVLQRERVHVSQQLKLTEIIILNPDYTRMNYISKENHNSKWGKKEERVEKALEGATVKQNK